MDLIETAVALELFLSSFHLNHSVSAERVKIQVAFADCVSDDYEVYTRDEDSGRFPSSVAFSSCKAITPCYSSSLFLNRSR